METCQTPGCEAPVNRKGHTLCYSCWKAARGRAPESSQPVAERGAESKAPETAHGGNLSSTKLGKALGISNRRVNLILAELGWIEKFTKGWKPTAQGEKHGGKLRTMEQTGVPFVVWPGSLLNDKVFLAVAQEMGGESAVAEDGDATSSSEQTKPAVEDGRTRFPAKYRAADGHYVRSRAELSIDNWLYMQGIVHAYERKIPVEEDAYCDFYLPQSKVYIEYWGMEKDPAYAARKAEKQALYARHGFRLVELGDAELENLDDNLPRLLIPHGVDCS